MRLWLAALFLFTLNYGSTSAQEVINGAYDGRSIAGWTYSPELSAQVGFAVWAPADDSINVGGLHCGIRLEPGITSSQQWDEKYGSLTAEVLRRALGQASNPEACLSTLSSMDAGRFYSAWSPFSVSLVGR